MKTIALKAIACWGNRNYTKDEGFDQLVESIRKHGIIEPPVVRQTTEGNYRVVAGRRRIEAAQQLDIERIECNVLDSDDPRSDEEIALSENVNRLDMHPLDEAALFGHMAAQGAPIEEIARRYARSPSAIYKRLRLAGLAEELKGLFRDGKLGIGGAAALAELPEEDQREFFDKFENFVEIHNAHVMEFIGKKRLYEIKDGMKGCDGCAKRTHNRDNDLFEEFKYLNDACLDGDCYRLKWRGMIEAALAEAANAADKPTDNKIHFANGIPELLYKKATHVEFSAEGPEPARYEVLREKDYEFDWDTKRKNGCCWIVRDGIGSALIISRAGYKPKEKEKQEAKADASEVKRYGIEALQAIAADRADASPEDIARELEAKKVRSYDFTEVISEKMYERVVARRIELDREMKDAPRDYFSMFLRALDEEYYGSGEFIEKEFSTQQKRWLSEIVGVDSLKQIPLSESAQRLFHFLLLCTGALNEMWPDIDYLKGIEKKKNLFWEYAGMDKEAYKALYIEAAKAAAAALLQPTEKKGGKKKKTAEAAQGDVRRCRVCGCTDNDCRQCVEKTGEPCHWIEEDLCSACADAGDDGEDNYPFEPDESDPDTDAGDA